MQLRDRKPANPRNLSGYAICGGALCSVTYGRMSDEADETGQGESEASSLFAIALGETQSNAQETQTVREHWDGVESFRDGSPAGVLLGSKELLTMSAYIFVSYSRDDEQFVTPIVGILRDAIAGVPSATGKYWEFVYQDVDSIEPGGRWKDQIDEAITRAERMFVFWCEHSSKSLQVEREYKLALVSEKSLSPFYSTTPHFRTCCRPYRGATSGS